MRLVFAGTPDVAVPSLDALLGSRHEVVAVVTRPDAPAGRGRKLVASPVAERATPRHGWVNLHFSLLPAWRGAAPVQHAVLHGDEITGATVFEIGEGLDDGPVYGTVTEPVRPTDTSGDLLARLA